MQSQESVAAVIPRQGGFSRRSNQDFYNLVACFFFSLLLLIWFFYEQCKGRATLAVLSHHANRLYWMVRAKKKKKSQFAASMETPFDDLFMSYMITSFLMSNRLV